MRRARARDRAGSGGQARKECRAVEAALIEVATAASRSGVTGAPATGPAGARLPEAVTRHLVTCPHCQRLAADLEAVVRELSEGLPARGLPGLTPATVDHRIAEAMRRADAIETRLAHRRRVAAYCAAALAVLAAHVVVLARWGMAGFAGEQGLLYLTLPLTVPYLRRRRLVTGGPAT